jgi:hypothetical protein
MLVTAGSVYEAVAAAVAVFRGDESGLARLELASRRSVSRFNRLQSSLAVWTQCHFRNRACRALKIAGIAKQLLHLSEALAERCKLSFGREPVLCFIEGGCRPQDWALRLFPNGLDKLSLRQRGPRWRKRHVRMAAAFVLTR